MPGPYFSPPELISIPKIIGRRYFLKITGTTEDIFRVPADGSFLLIRNELSRRLIVSYKHDRHSDGEVDTVYQKRGPISLGFNVITLDERDRERLFSWQYLGYDISVMEVYDDDILNPHLITVGPIEVEKWKIVEVNAKNPTGNITTGPYDIKLTEADFVDEGIEENQFFSVFKYAISVEKDAEELFVPSTWTGTSDGFKLVNDLNRTVDHHFEKTQIAFYKEIIEYSGRSNIELTFNFQTSNLEEIALIEWAKENLQPVKVYEWNSYPEGMYGKLFSLTLQNILSTYEVSAAPFGPTGAITPDEWRITDFKYTVADLSEYKATLVVTEL